MVWWWVNFGRYSFSLFISNNSHTETLLLTRWQKESAARKKKKLSKKKNRETWRRNSNIVSREVHCLITTNMFFAEHIFIHIRIKLPLEKGRCKYKEKDKIRGNTYFSFKTKKAPLNLLACFRANVGERKKKTKPLIALWKTKEEVKHKALHLSLANDRAHNGTQNHTTVHNNKIRNHVCRKQISTSESENNDQFKINSPSCPSKRKKKCTKHFFFLFTIQKVQSVTSKGN